VNINFENMCKTFYGDMLTTPDEAADLDYLLGEEADRQAKSIKEDPPDEPWHDGPNDYFLSDMAGGGTWVKGQNYDNEGNYLHD
jgi:hypothetical protein